MWHGRPRLCLGLRRHNQPITAGGGCARLPSSTRSWWCMLLWTGTIQRIAAMAVKKDGELRVRKGESIYGPMSRQDLERLLASGRFGLTDLVSVLGGPWMEVLQFVSPTPAAEDGRGHLRVLRANQIFGGLDQQRLRRLCAEGRVEGHDLVCALGGPWMPVADFLAPPREIAEEVLEAEEIYEAEPVELQVEYVPLKWYHVYRAEVDEPMADQWYVRVHGIHSAPLTRRQVQQLFFAREITGSSVARHITWHPEFWKPIDSIPELASMPREEEDP